MNPFCFDGIHFSGERPIVPSWSRHAGVLVLAGVRLMRARALPDAPIAARSGAFNCRV